MMPRKLNYTDTVKLAVACSLTSTPICHNTSLRVCKDCQLVTMLTSKVEQQTILVRGAYAFILSRMESVFVWIIGSVLLLKC